jgi:hypothetical protein
LAFAVGAFVASTFFDVVVTRDTSAWYLANTSLLIAVVVALTLWGFYRSVGGQLSGPD